MRILHFNGYQVSESPGGTFPARTSGGGNPYSLPEGLYTIEMSSTALTDTPQYPLVQTPVSFNVCTRMPVLFAFGDDSVFGVKVDPLVLSYLRFSTMTTLSGALNLSVKYAAPWMRYAFQEIGQKEVAGKKANPRILQYFKSSGYWGDDDSGGKNAWCASFVSWVMEQASYESPKSAYRAKAWAAFGTPVPDPVFGAIGIKKRAGGGHVAFVVGGGDGCLYMLGGNQQDEVRISRYPRGVWSTFVVPTGYDASRDGLPTYDGPATQAGAEA